VFANNPASARVLEKAGFTFEGRLKNNVMKDGQVLDSLLYAEQSSAVRAGDLRV
jgi:RimJ/RimL family protein N-acetyltransferase